MSHKDFKEFFFILRTAFHLPWLPQALVVLPGEAWSTSLGSSATPQHIIQPTTLHLTLFKCLIGDDAKLPQFKGEKDSITFDGNKQLDN